MIRKNKRQKPKEATTIKRYVIPECNRVLTEKTSSMRRAMNKLIQVDSFVPAWPWEMKYYGFTGIIRHYVQKMLVA